MLSGNILPSITAGVIFILNFGGFSFLLNSQGGNGTSQAVCGSSLGTIKNSETLTLVVGLVIMFILVIYTRLVTVHLTVNYSIDVLCSNVIIS